MRAAGRALCLWPVFLSIWEREKSGFGCALAAVEFGEGVRGGAEKVAQEQGEVTGAAAEPLAPISGGTGDGVGIKRREPAFEGAGKGDIFHQWLVGVAAALPVKRGGNQQGLIAIGQAKEAAAQVGPAGHKAGRKAGGIIAEAEVSGLIGGGKMGLRGGDPAT